MAAAASPSITTLTLRAAKVETPTLRVVLAATLRPMATAEMQLAGTPTRPAETQVPAVPVLVPAADQVAEVMAAAETVVVAAKAEVRAAMVSAAFL